MIKFFRHIRKRVLNESQFRRYLAYAVGEIVLVMVGILLALQFNNWNSNRINNTKEIWYLDNIANDMHFQKETLKDIDTSYNEAITISKSILKDYLAKKSFAKIDSLNEKLNILMLSNSFPNIDNTYREMVSSGQLSLIENANLSSKIIDFYLLSEEAESIINSDIINVYYKEIFPVFNKFTQVNLDGIELNDDELILLKTDPTLTKNIQKRLEDPKNILALLNAIKSHILATEHHLILITETIEDIDKMIKEIDNEIGLLQ